MFVKYKEIIQKAICMGKEVLGVGKIRFRRFRKDQKERI